MSSRWGAVVLILVLVAGCTSEPEAKPPPAPEPLTWTQIALPHAEEPVLLTPIGDNLLIGLRRLAGTTVPRLRLRDPAGRLTEVPLRPKSPYAFEAVWRSIGTDGTRIVAIGGAPGGAHANTRYTAWSGSTRGVTELPQSFNTFGGWGAGGVLDAVLTPAGSALVGTWGTGDQGLDGAIWLPASERWVRQNTAGTPLQNTRELLVGPRSATASGTGLVVAGSQVGLGSGAVRQHAAVWRSDRVNQGWRRIELPDPGDRSEAVAVNCTPTNCLISGWVDGQLALWRLTGSTATRLPDVPAIPVGDKDKLAPPFEHNGHLIQLAATSGQIKTLRHDGTTWTVHDSTGPVGNITDATLIDDTLYLLAGAADPAATLWQTPLLR